MSGLLALGVASAALDGVVLAPSALARSTSGVELRLRRSPGRVDVVIAGLGTEVRAVSQNQSDGLWSARLTGVYLGDRPFTPQQQVISSSELLSVRLEPLDSDLQLIVKARMGKRVPTPTIGSNGESLVVSFAGLKGSGMRSSGRLDLRRPGRVVQPVMAPPMRPRAVAPPLGDMAVGTMLINNRSFVKASGPPVSLTLNNAPAKDALMSLARLGGFGFVFVGDGDTPSDADSSEYPVSMAFRNERYDRALNSVLMASGLQGRLDGNTLLVGTAVSAKSFGPQMSKVFRMNQVDVESASQYLGNLGAVMNSPSQGDSDSSVASYSSGYGPLIGLTGTADSRLNTITLVGDPKLISVAQNYLRQIDLRKRQVAVKVQILSVDLDNNKSVNTSFSSRIGDKFIVSENGNAYINFGKYKPSSASGTGVYSGDSGYLQPGVYDTNTEIGPMKRFVRPFVARQVRVETKDEDGNITYSLEDYINESGEKEYIRDPNPDSLAEKEMIDEKSGLKLYEKVNDNERYRQPDNSFYAYLNSVIVSSSAKTLAQPTLLVQEGEQAKVEAGESVITGRTTTETSNNSTEFTFTRENAGLVLDLKVSRIDDNGFITMEVNPQISVPVGAGNQGGVPIFNLSGRKLQSGSIRLRDRQTLILTGVIQESDRQQAQKWPILGDLPIVGQLFRSSSSTRQKTELVIVVTPTVLDDDNGGSYGYGYRPGTPAGRELIQAGT
ncbi:general secretion pathway protein GspD [Synechococcus sp. YX-04-1]|uniref:type II secretion system protein GspD n=1 Tax=Synechococcus sp. YX-04-1 TaxID=3062778 RepID=UPI0026E15C67|nr:general secretion pathway protein GspD [Synechococcus sp. YX-04-1]MDO6351451.1 general secretion pathway protein GspD [Synechococcus sp. YX-04-1]